MREKRPVRQAGEDIMKSVVQELFFGFLQGYIGQDPAIR
jgi:hypothetical protein